MQKSMYSNIQAAAQALLPVFCFIMLYETALAASDWMYIWLCAAQAAGRLPQWLSSGIMDSEADFRAAACGIGMALSFLPFTGQCAGAVRRTRKLIFAENSAAKRRPRLPNQVQWIVPVTGTICLSLGVNSLLSLTRLSGSAAGQDSLAGSVSLPLGIAVFGMLTPFAEEFIFRGLLYDRLRFVAGMGKMQAVFLGSAVFALYHGNPAQAIYAFIMSFAFFYIWLSEGQPGLVCGLHAACNIFSLLLASLGVYNLICTPVWCACLMAVALICGAILRPLF